MESKYVTVMLCFYLLGLLMKVADGVLGSSFSFYAVV